MLGGLGKRGVGGFGACLYLHNAFGLIVVRIGRCVLGRVYGSGMHRSALLGA